MARTSGFSFLTSYARQSKEDPERDDELVIPEDLTELDGEELAGLSDQANTAFEQLYGDGEQVNSDDLAQLESLAAGIETIRAEQDRRTSEQNERTEAAAAIAARVKPQTAETETAAEDCEDCEQTEGEGGEVIEMTDGDQSAEAEVADERPVETIAASAEKKPIRVNLSGLRSRQPRNSLPTGKQPETMADLVYAAPDLPGYSNGQGMTWEDLGRGVDRRLTGFQPNQYDLAARSGQHLRQQYGVAVIRKPFSPELTVSSDDPAHVDQVFQHAMDERRLPGGSLVAAAGWCAPSETIYDLCELESSDGLVSLPEISVSRGGIRYTLGPDFGTLYDQTGFCYTEAEVEAGDYDGAGGGSKPCYYVDCPDFVETRLDLCGTCISAGLLQARGYPEVIARTTRGALIAHGHRLSSNIINRLVAGSTAVSFATGQVGATAPILTAIELQVENIKYRHRMSRGSSMEAIFPYWVRGAIRADLARRLGVELIDVPDNRINSWFSSRGISPQFVYDWQPLTDANGTAYPETVQFLLYPAGTWVKGSSDIITLDTLYDSTLLGQNDYTALFTEEGYLVAKLCHDSRVVTVPICSDGATAGGVAINCDGALEAAPAA